ncbi:MAG: HAD family hydrolase [Mycobacteriales bacterium]
MPVRCLITDYGGVLTAPIGRSWRIWAEKEGLDVEGFERVMTQLCEGGAEAQFGAGVELGTVTEAELEQYLARQLRRHDGQPVLPHGLLQQLWAALAGEPEMLGVFRRAKRHGIATALLSNSWGMGYDRTDWDRLFDVVVISAEVGLRKPDPEIYRHTLSLLGLQPGECVFIDDLPQNVRAAVEIGMIGVHHTEVDATIVELEALTGVPLR